MSSLRVLRTFVAVATEGSFAAAANRVALTQAAVGLQMRSLETEVRRTLFERQGKSVRLNENGREMLPMVRQVIAQYDRMLASPGPAAPMAGTVHLGAVVSAVRPLVRATLGLKARHPGLDLHVSAAKSIELVAQVESGQLDAAIVVREPAHGRPGLQWTALYSEPMVLLSGPDASGGSVREIAQRHPFIRFDRSQHTGRLVERTLRKLRIKPTDFLELNSIETIVELVRSGLGVAILPLLRDSDWQDDPSLRIEEIAGVTEPRVLALVQARDRSKSSLVNAVASEFQSHTRIR